MTKSWAALLVLAVLLRAFVPAGFMLDANAPAGAFGMVFCSGHGAVTMAGLMRRAGRADVRSSAGASRESAAAFMAPMQGMRGMGDVPRLRGMKDVDRQLSAAPPARPPARWTGSGPRRADPVPAARAGVSVTGNDDEERPSADAPCAFTAALCATLIATVVWMFLFSPTLAAKVYGPDRRRVLIRRPFSGPPAARGPPGFA
ncbi:hypothetical protein OVY01_05830 [Robbsia sp. Bb-Pol-6]|uniref:Uncharacterized protein n=1 Tax=Robbsia betulipollinis TaxID=2981849 RepID=A0ABT3ZJQ3_9BURK|nr:hypothetical protein [Robbsia betulipollinis]MCY0386764.1 hypothetical protein [Robbsia betulipollinis]